MSINPCCDDRYETSPVRVKSRAPLHQVDRGLCRVQDNVSFTVQLERDDIGTWINHKSAVEHKKDNVFITVFFTPTLIGEPWCNLGHVEPVTNDRPSLGARRELAVATVAVENPSNCKTGNNRDAFYERHHGWTESKRKDAAGKVVNASLGYIPSWWKCIKGRAAPAKA